MNTILSPNWDKLQQAAINAPAIMVNNFCSQIVALQNHIATREEGSRFPSLQEANLQFKLISCMEKLKKYPSDAMSMQAVNMFIRFMDDEDPDTGYYLGEKFKEFMLRKGNKDFSPFDLEYNADPYAGAQQTHAPAAAFTAQPASQNTGKANPTATQPTSHTTTQPLSSSTIKDETYFINNTTPKTNTPHKKPKQKKVHYSNKYTYGKTG